MGSRSRQTVRLLYAKSERIGLPKCTSLARSARQVSLVLLPAATRRASNQPRSAVVLGRNAQTAVVAGRFGERVKSTRSGSSGRSMSDRHGATRKFCTWQGSRRKCVVVAPKGLLYGLPARPAARTDLDDGLALLQVAGLSLCAPARKGLAMFAVQAGSKQLLIPRAAMDVAAVRSFGLLGALAPPNSARTSRETASGPARAVAARDFRGLWPANT